MKKLALVLGGGASKGYAHIGILKVLEDNNIKPDLIVGTSMGAIIGGAYACGMDIENLTSISTKLTKSQFVDFNILGLVSSTGMLRGKKLRNILYRALGNITHNDTCIKFIAVATDINAGKQEILKEGLVVESMMASLAVPSVFPAIEKDDKLLCDGGILNNLPEDVAKQFGGEDVILSIDVIGSYNKQVESSKVKIVGLTINVLTLMQTQITKLKPQLSDLRISVSQPDVAQTSFNKASVEKSIAYGEQAMKRNMTKLKKLLRD